MTPPKTKANTKRRGSPRRERSGLVVVANRLPVRRVSTGKSDRWQTSPGGLVSALAPILQKQGGAWVGWPGVTGTGPRPFTHEGIDIRPVSISESELDDFYHGFSNHTCWPLYHDALRFPTFHRRWWRPYVEVNERFAENAAAEVKDGDLVWVHDYQLQLVPEALRERCPNAKIGFFNHIPFPPQELFAKMPWRREVLEGLLGADLIGFQTKLSAQNFISSAKRFTDATGTGSTLLFDGRRIEVRAFPVSIDFDRVDELARTPETIARAARLKADLGGRRIVLGVDRLDYTKGIDTRLRSIEEVLERGRFGVDDFVALQVSVPSREAVEHYSELRDLVERLVGRINGAHGRPGFEAVHYLYRNLSFEELAAYYVAADVILVTPYRDGMNLVAKEYCAAHTNNRGVLVLSEFAGAALELKQAMLVNPHDVDGMASVIEGALSMDEDDAKKRMKALRRTVRTHDVYRWSEEFLEALAAHRRSPSPRRGKRGG